MKKLSLLALPVLFALGCGGVDTLFGDGGLDSGSVCAAGVTPYQIKTGVYKTQSVPSVTENCGLGLTAANLMTDREVANDAQGNITVYSLSTTPKAPLGTGPVRCNMGTLTGSDIANASGCDFTRQTTVSMTVTAANQFTIAVTQTRSNFKQDASVTTCKPPAGNSCTISYTAAMQQ
jgi:hypothetical protein